MDDLLQRPGFEYFRSASRFGCKCRVGSFLNRSDYGSASHTFSLGGILAPQELPAGWSRFACGGPKTTALMITTCASTCAPDSRNVRRAYHLFSGARSFEAAAAGLVRARVEVDGKLNVCEVEGLRIDSVNAGAGRQTVPKTFFGTLLSMARRNCVDKDRVREYCRRTLVGATGASPIFQVTHYTVPHIPSPSANLRVSDEGRPSNLLRRAACQ